MKSRKRLIIVSVIVLSVFLLVIITVAALFCVSALIPLEITDTDKYLKTDGFKSYFILFPDDLKNVDGQIDEYLYRDRRLLGGCVVFLKVSYTDDDAYQKEKERLANESYTITVGGPSVKQYTQLDDTLFSYPAVISMYDSDKKFEYALYDDTTLSVMYCFLQDLAASQTGIPTEYLPKSVIGDTENESDFSHSYNVYVYSEEDRREG